MSATSNFRDGVATRVARGVSGLSRSLRLGAGTVIGGRVGLFISPNLMAHLTKGRVVVLVSGTNGKTTTTALIARGWGEGVTTNDTGSNMPPGHVGAMAFSLGERTVLEVDEAWLDRVVVGGTGQGFVPKVLVLLNLSRDQLDRANEVRTLAGRWRAMLSSELASVVVANANDPLVVYAAERATRVEWCDVPTPWTSDAVSCPHCTRRLHFDDTRWWCDCGFAKPTTIATSLGDTLAVKGMTYELDLQLPGAFNRSNAALAVTALAVLGVSPSTAIARMQDLRSVAGRFSVRRWREHELRLLLAKNPAGFAAMLDTIEDDGHDVWVAINARAADGRDPSWLYDVPFELLRGHRVWCFGDRRLDLATRLEYAGVEVVVVDSDDEIPAPSGPAIALLANYTAFQDWLARTTPC